jgi:hypothetical protein
VRHLLAHGTPDRLGVDQDSVQVEDDRGERNRSPV